MMFLEGNPNATDYKTTSCGQKEDVINKNAYLFLLLGVSSFVQSLYGFSKAPDNLGGRLGRFSKQRHGFLRVFVASCTVLWLSNLENKEAQIIIVWFIERVYVGYKQRNGYKLSILQVGAKGSTFWWREGGSQF